MRLKIFLSCKRASSGPALPIQRYVDQLSALGYVNASWPCWTTSRPGRIHPDIEGVTDVDYR
jgi:hypothetical protein